MGDASTEEKLKQHVVSQVLLRRWAVDGNLLVYDLRHDRARPRPPSAEGYITGFTRVGARRFEGMWGGIEQHMPRVFSAVDDGSLFDAPSLIGRLKDFVALHFVRSRTMREAHRRSTDHAIAKLVDEGDDLRDPQRLDHLFRLRFGLEPAGPGARLAAYDAALTHIRANVEEGSGFFGERLEENFQVIRDRLDRWHAQIGVAADGAEFAIADDPVQTVHAASGRVGILSGVTLADADALLLPLGPRHIFSVALADEYFAVNALGVAKLNSAQFAAADQKVFLRPGSRLEVVASSWRAEQVRRLSGDAPEG